MAFGLRGYAPNPKCMSVAHQRLLIMPRLRPIGVGDIWANTRFAPTVVHGLSTIVLSVIGYYYATAATNQTSRNGNVGIADNERRGDTKPLTSGHHHCLATRRVFTRSERHVDARWYTVVRGGLFSCSLVPTPHP